MDTLKEIKQYAGNRHSIRLNTLGFINARITKVPHKKLKGMLKQIINLENTAPLSPSHLIDKPIIEKEIEFRELCLSLKSVFDIKLK